MYVAHVLFVPVRIMKPQLVLVQQTENVLRVLLVQQTQNTKQHLVRQHQIVNVKHTRLVLVLDHLVEQENI